MIPSLLFKKEICISYIIIQQFNRVTVWQFNKCYYLQQCNYNNYYYFVLFVYNPTGTPPPPPPGSEYVLGLETLILTPINMMPNNNEIIIEKTSNNYDFGRQFDIFFNDVFTIYISYILSFH